MCEIKQLIFILIKCGDQGLNFYFIFKISISASSFFKCLKFVKGKSKQECTAAKAFSPLCLQLNYHSLSLHYTCIRVCVIVQQDKSLRRVLVLRICTRIQKERWTHLLIMCVFIQLYMMIILTLQEFQAVFFLSPSRFLHFYSLSTKCRIIFLKRCSCIKVQMNLACLIASLKSFFSISFWCVTCRVVPSGLYILCPPWLWDRWKEGDINWRSRNLF